MEEIKDLTPEQFRALETHYREWRAVAVRSGPTDHERVEKAIGKLYTVCSYDWPTFVWYESPREMLMSLATSLLRFGRVALKDSLCPCTAGAIFGQSFSKLVRRQRGCRLALVD